MVIYIANGNPVIATILISLSAFKRTALRSSFRSIKLSFSSEEAAQNFVENANTIGVNYSKPESTSVFVFPDFGGSTNVAKAIYHAVDAYKDSLTSVNEFDIDPVSEADKSFLEDIEQYLKEYFGSDAVTIEATVKK